jgi:hypothetical protein
MIMKATERDTLAGAIDILIAKGGSWEFLEKAGNAESFKRGMKTRWTKGTLVAHINYRLASDDNYLGRHKITTQGIY